MKVIIAGGTGFLGHELSQFFTQRNDEVVVLTRGASRTEHGLSFVHWDATTLGDWKVEFSDADVLINLSGKSVDCRFTEKNRKRDTPIAHRRH
jgi:NAD dependent epimerase/dehydratase family enzyme